MKLLQLKINKWRNLEGVVFDIPPEASLVCLVGENGTGKSNVLELASAVAHRAGIAPGVNMSRGDPFKEPCDLEARVRITATPEKYLPELLPEYVPDEGLQWNGEIHLRANRGADNVLQLSLSAGGFPEPQATHLGQQIVNAVNQRKDTHHLYLDSDRSYPPLDIHGAHYAEALVREWDTAEWKKNRA
jgi:hypothetical protein